MAGGEGFRSGLVPADLFFFFTNCSPPRLQGVRNLLDQVDSDIVIESLCVKMREMEASRLYTSQKVKKLSQDYSALLHQVRQMGFEPQVPEPDTSSIEKHDQCLWPEDCYNFQDLLKHNKRAHLDKDQSDLTTSAPAIQEAVIQVETE